MLPSSEFFRQQSLRLGVEKDLFTSDSWHGYDRLFVLDRALFEDRLTPHTLAVVHPGFYTYFTYPDRDPPFDYLRYQDAMRATVQEALDQNHCVLAWVSANHRRGALDAMGVNPTDDRIMLVPTIAGRASPAMDCARLGIGHPGIFWESMQRKVHQLTLCGEYYMPEDGTGCVYGVLQEAVGYIPNVTVINHATYNPRSNIQPIAR